MMQKPYCTLVGRNWIVLDSNGDATFTTRNKQVAFMFLNNNYPELCKATLPTIEG